MRKAEIFFQDRLAGVLIETDMDYLFQYNASYLDGENPVPVSLTLPLSPKPYKNRTLFPCFDGLIPEGWLLSIAEKNWKINPRDRMGLLLVCCKDCIGALSVREVR
jgi:serine/threonine-protein kinase HipA